MPTVKVFRFGEEVILEGDDAQAVLDEQAALRADQAAIPRQRFVKTTDLLARMEDSECDLFDAALAAMPSRKRLRWIGEQAIDIDAPEWREMFADIFGQARGDALLDPTA
jgi:hypothetical protein